MNLLQFLEDKGVSLSVEDKGLSVVVNLGRRSSVFNNHAWIKDSMGCVQEMIDAYKPLKIYLACPYSHSKDKIRHKRFVAATKKTAELMKSGYLVYSPITSCHPVATRHNIPTGWEYWKELDKTFIEWCDELWVLCLDGWKESKGVQAEIAIAEELGKKVVHHTWDFDNVKDEVQRMYQITYRAPSIASDCMVTTGDIAASAGRGEIHVAMDAAELAERRRRGL